MLQSSERRFFFLPAREPKPSEAKEKFRKQKASFGAHAHRHLCAPARLYLYRSPSPRVKGLAGSSERGRREQLSDGRERESARPEKTVSLFAPKARGEKRNQIFPMGETREGETPRVLPLSSPPASLSLSTVLAHLGVHAAQEVIKLLDGGAPVWALAVRRDPGERLRRAPAARAVLPRGGIVVLSRGVVGVLEPQIVGEELLLGRARRQAQRDDGLRHAGAKGKTKRENRGRDQILFFLFFFFLLERILKFQFMVAVEAGKKKVFFRPPLFQSLLFSISRLQVRKSDQLRAGALFLCLFLCRLCGSDAQSLSLGKKEREEERGGLPLLSPVSSLSRARALFSLLLLLLLFTLLSFSVSLSHFRSSLLREKLLLCPT